LVAEKMSSFVKIVVMTANRLGMLLELLRESPHESFLLFAIAKEYEKTGDREQALQYYQRLERDDPDYVGTYYHLGKLYEQLQDTTAAFRTYTAGMDTARKLLDQHAYSELAGARLALGDEDDFL
jgi:tetratricopeptide (TPR) repeat protein